MNAAATTAAGNGFFRTIPNALTVVINVDKPSTGNYPFFLSLDPDSYQLYGKRIVGIQCNTRNAAGVTPGNVTGTLKGSLIASSTTLRTNSFVLTLRDAMGNNIVENYPLINLLTTEPSLTNTRVPRVDKKFNLLGMDPQQSFVSTLNPANVIAKGADAVCLTFLYYHND